MRMKCSMKTQSDIRFRTKILPTAALFFLMFTGGCRLTHEVEPSLSNPAQLGGAEDSAGAVMNDASSTGARSPSVEEGTYGAADETPLLKVTRLPVFRKEAPDGMREELSEEEGPEIIPLIWDGEPMPLKVIAGGSGLAVVDFYEGVLKVYRRGYHLTSRGVVDGVSITQSGGLVVATHSDLVPEVTYFPDSDLSQIPRSLRPSRTRACSHYVGSL